MINETDRTDVPGIDPASIHIVLWAITADPVILAVIAYALKIAHAGERLSGTVTNPLFLIFAALALASIWSSFHLASGKLDPKLVSGVAAKATGITLHLPFRIIAVALAITPAILGFVLHLLTGDDRLLLVFNGAALAVAVRHVLVFTGSDRPR